MDLDDCRSKAFDLYKRTVNNPAFNGTNYWQIGCVFDTLTDYLQQDAGFLDPKVSAQQVQAFMASTCDFYQSLVTQTEHNYSWYDDFAWWGIACSKAYNPNFGIFGNLRGRYQQICLATWQTMKNGKCDHVHYGAPNVWDKCDQELFAVCKPKIDGGVWQYDIFGAPRPLEDSPVNPSTPIDVDGYAAVSLGPFQLTVVNGLYFVLANRLVEPGFEDRKTSDGILQYFVGWFNVTDAPRLVQTVDGGVLIRERVSVYANGTKVNEWDAANSWGGDQGLLLGALADYKQQHGAQPGFDIDAWIKDLMGGVAGSMQKSDSGFTFMMPWFPFDAGLFGTDLGDYSSGLGVYMRYLNYAYGFDATVQSAINDNSNPMRILVLNSAQAVMEGKLPRWKADGVYPFDYFNQLAIMVMAISLLKPKN
jgi:hypothetical protein